MRLWIVVALTAAAGLRALGQAAAPADPGAAASAEVRKQVEAAWERADLEGLSTALESAWTADARWAREACYRLMTGDAALHRPIGAVQLARHADARAIAQAADALRVNEFPDERRLLVRALGSKEPAPAGPLARRFLSDPDDMVRIAAILALADLGDPDAVGHVVRQLPLAPAEEGQWDGDAGDIRAFALFGMAQRLSGVRANSARAIADWWRRGHKPVTPPELPPGGYETGMARGQRYFASPSFDVYLRVQGVGEPEPEGPLSWSELVAAIEEPAARARSAASRVFGPIHVPVVRLYACDRVNFTPFAGKSYLGGGCRGNEIAINLDAPQYLSQVMTHEMVHIIHLSQYEKQTRWVAEGLADSLTMSPTASSWTADRVAARGLERDVRSGVISGVIGWSDSANSGPREMQRYALAHLAVDFLRFGGFTPGDERLQWLMGAISRGGTDAQVLERVYGMPVRELDRRLEAWLTRDNPP